MSSTVLENKPEKVKNPCLRCGNEMVKMQAQKQKCFNCGIELTSED